MKKQSHLDVLIQRLVSVMRHYAKDMGKIEEDHCLTMDAEIDGLHSAITSAPAQTLEQVAVQIAISLRNASFLRTNLTTHFWEGKEIDKHAIMGELDELSRVLHSAMHVLEKKLPKELFREHLTHIETGERQETPFPKVA